MFTLFIGNGNICTNETKEKVFSLAGVIVGPWCRADVEL